jgi:hypothetical protein
MCSSLIKALFILSFLGSLAFAQRPKPAKFNAITSFNKVKEQIVELLAKNQRIAAMTLIENELLRDDKEYKNKLNSLKFNMLNDFLSLSTQEIYETSAGLVLNDKKKALSGLQQCLAREPENLQCRWLELKYYSRYNRGLFDDKALAYIETAQSFKQLQLLKNSLLATLDRSDEISLNTNSKEAKNLNSEDLALENIINYNIAIDTKNYPKAKEIINYMNIHYVDYPDLIFMSYQLSTLWPEGVGFSESSLEKKFEVYRKKCTDLPISVARKYFFDISLCVRSLK